MGFGGGFDQGPTRDPAPKAPPAPEPKAPAPAPVRENSVAQSALNVPTTSTVGEAFKSPTEAVDSGGAIAETISGVGGVVSESPALGALGVAGGLARAKGQWDTAVHGRKTDGTEASTLDRVKDGMSLASTAGNTTKLAADGVTALATNNVVGKMAQTGMTGAGPQAAAKAAISGGNSQAIKAAARAAQDAEKAKIAAAAVKAGQPIRYGADLKHGVNTMKHAANAATTGNKVASVGKVASTVASGAKTALSGAGDAAALVGKGVARNGGRFVPGLNAAIAVGDTVAAGNDIADWHNGKASGGKAITSGIRALGSIASATNIPIVSQVGAGVSVLADLAQRFWWSK